MSPHSLEKYRTSVPSTRSAVFSRRDWRRWLLLSGAALLSCSSDDTRRAEVQALEPGVLKPATLVFADETGGAGGTGAAGGSGAAPAGDLPLGGGAVSPTAFGDDTFEQYIDPPRQTSQYCGDGAYDPDIEECDDGVGDALDSCTQNCQTRDVLAVPAAVDGDQLSRKLGLGRHPLSGGPFGGAVTWVDASADPKVVVQLRDVYGNRASEVVVADASLAGEDESRPVLASHPVVATLPDGTHVVAYNDLNGDGSELGVALRSVSHLSGTLGEVRFANTSTIGAQSEPDLLWTSEGLVAAWVDTSDDLTGPDVRYQLFDANLAPIGGEASLATSDLPEGAVTLCTAPGDDPWAAAWRRGELDGSETLVVQQGTKKVEFRATVLDVGDAPSAEIPDGMGGAGPDEGVTRLMPGHMEDRLGLSPLGDGLFAVAFTVGTDPGSTGVANVFRLWVAVVDVNAGTVPWIGPIAPLLDGAPDEFHSQRSPTMADASAPTEPGASGQVFVGWRAESRLGDAAAEELWLKRLRWDDQAGTLIATDGEVPLTRDETSRPGDQRQPAFANIVVPGGHALAMAWEDWGTNFDLVSETQARPDIVVQVAPVPLRRDPSKVKDCGSTPCLIGEGPCADDDECAGGLQCAERRGPWHGYGPATAVCEPASCTNDVRDSGEVGVDCGGDCGPCFACLGESSSAGTAHFCSAVCPCDNVEGDCDSDYDCDVGLECFEDTGDVVGLPKPIDLCLEGACRDGVKNGNETRVDCGGVDCAPCRAGPDSYCTEEVPCAVEGEGSCSSDLECDGGLVCRVGQGAHYGYSHAAGACVPDTCPVERLGAFQFGACFDDCQCGDGAGQCAGDADCLGGRCEPERGIYYGKDPTISVCVADSCFNGEKDANETQIDCGGPCGAECPACPGDPSFKSFEGPANWTIVSGSGITTAKSTIANHGEESLEFAGCGTATLRSPVFSGSVFEVLGDDLLLDLARLDQAGVTYPGPIDTVTSVQLGLFQAGVGSTTLISTTLVDGATGEFLRQRASLPEALRDAIAANAGDLQLEISVERPCNPTVDGGTAFLRFDHVRLGGENTAFRSICEEDLATGEPDASIFGFEDSTLWTSAQANLSDDGALQVQGSYAMAADAVVHSVTSDDFSLGASTKGRLLLDVRLPSGSSGGTVGMTLSCPSVSITNVDLGSHSISSLSDASWVTLPFTIPSAELSTVRAGASDCSATITTTPTTTNGSAEVLYDDLRFADDTYCSQYQQIAGFPFVVGYSPTPDGSATKPYRLCTAAQMQTVMDDNGIWNDNIVLEADIDLSGVTGQIGYEGVNWYRGTFDGQGHYLSNYTYSGGDYSGLFGQLLGDGTINNIGDGVVKNLTLADANVSGLGYVGVIAGFTEYATVEDVYVAGGTVTSGAQFTGGVAGRVTSSTVVRTVSTAAVLSQNGADTGGLIGQLMDSTVRDSRAHGALSGVSAGNPWAGSYMGGLVGRVFGATSVVESSLASGDVSSVGGWVGGLIGSLSNGNTRQSFATGDTTGVSRVGGLVGEALAGVTISNSVATGDVAAATKGGGLAGELVGAHVSDSWALGAVDVSSSTGGGLVGITSSSATIKRSYAQGDVEAGTSEAGGLVGLCGDTAISDAYASGSVSAVGDPAAGVVGSFTNCALTRVHSMGVVSPGLQRGTVAGADLDVSPAESVFVSTFGALEPNSGMDPVHANPTEPGVANLTAAEFRDPNTFADWDFFGTWEMGEAYPVLRRNWCQLYEQMDAAPFVVGMAAEKTPNGSALKPYRLCNAAQVQWVMDNGSASLGGLAVWDSNFRLESDIDLSGVVGQIGTSTTAFHGTFDGGGRKLANYEHIEPAASNLGLFADMYGIGAPDGYMDGEIKNLVLENFVLSGSGWVGTLIGRNRGVIRNVIARGGTVTGTGGAIGGLVGQNYYAQIEGARAEGVEVVCGSSSCGGVTGQNYNGTVIDSHTVEGRVLGPVAGVYVGGLVGHNVGAIAGSSSSGLVEAPLSSNVGGLVGYQNGAGSSVVECSSSAPVNGSTRVGGLVGLSDGTAFVVETSATGAVSGVNDVGGLIGYQGTGATTSDSTSSGFVDATGQNAGGLVGYLSASLVERSEAQGKTSAPLYVGGFVGAAYASTISESRATGVVVASDDYAGGFAGLLENATVSDSSALGDVGSETAGWMGGFVGSLATSTLNTVAAFGDCEGSGAIGGLIGGTSGESLVVRGRATGTTRSEDSSVGGLVGETTGPLTLRECEAEGDVLLVGGTFAGGLVGYASEASGEGIKIYQSTASGNVTGTGVMGGLVGYVERGSVSDSSARGRVVGTSGSVGGLIGSAAGQTAVVRSYALGSVSGEGDYAGGLLGALTDSTVVDSYSTGSVSSGTTGAGGLIGQLDNSTVERSYTQRGVVTSTSSGAVVGEWAGAELNFDSVYGNSDENPGLWPVAGLPAQSGVALLTSSQMTDPSSFVGWDFESTWMMGAEGPELRSGYCTQTMQLDEAPFAVGTGTVPQGTKDSPFVLCNATQLQAVMDDSTLWASYFELGQTIPANGLVGQIGNATEAFTGTLDGQGFGIVGYRSVAAGDDKGLFGSVVGDGIVDGATDGRIADLVLFEPEVSGVSRVGALVGVGLDAVIENVTVRGGQVVATGSDAGGLVGRLGSVSSQSGSHSVVRNSTVESTVSGFTFVGGVVGQALDGTLFDQVQSSGSVEALPAGSASVGGIAGGLSSSTLFDSGSTSDVEVGGSYGGGLVGEAHDSALAVCSAAGDVQAADHAGGLIGYSVNTSVAQCWSSGSVTSLGDYAGGLVGRTVDGLVNDSFATGAVSGATSVGALIGASAGTSVSRTYAIGEVTGGAPTGALFGSVDASTYLSSSFASSSVNGALSLIGNGAGAGVLFLTDLELADWSTFSDAGWQIGSIWSSGSNGPTLGGGSSLEDEHCLNVVQDDGLPFSLGMEVTPNGSSENPYILCTAGQVTTVMGSPALWSKRFVLAADINLASANGQIGNGTGDFTGVFDGAGHKLFNYSPATSAEFAGLFRKVSGEIRNLTLVGFQVSGSSSAGTLAGAVEGGLIESVTAKASTVGATGDRAGGLVGTMTGGIVRDSDVDVAVSAGSNSAGGLIGYLVEGSVSSSSATGNVLATSGAGGLIGGAGSSGFTRPRVRDSFAGGTVSGTSSAGGLVGSTGQGAGVLIERCAALGAVAAPDYAGGLIGDAYDSVVHDSLASGAVSASSSVAGALVGRSFGSSFLRSLGVGAVTGGTSLGSVAGDSDGNSHYFSGLADGTTNGSLPPIAAGTARQIEIATTSELEDADFLAALDWDLSTVWEIAAGGPRLMDRSGVVPFCEEFAQSAAVPFASGLAEVPDGTKSRPYHICNSAQLATIAGDTDLWGSYFVVEADLDLSAFSLHLGDAGTPFSGTFDGHGHLLSGYAAVEAGAYAGLFGRVLGDGGTDGAADGHLQSINAVDFNVDGVGNVGALVGYLDNGQGRQLQVRGSVVTGTGSGIGGIVGNSNSPVSDLSADVAVSSVGGGALGGALGVSGGDVMRASAHGDVALTSGTSDSPVGGCVGKQIAGTISASSATGQVSTDDDIIGGFVGTQSAGALIENSSASGDVFGASSGQKTGGFVGMHNGAIETSVASGAVSGDQKVGGFCGTISSGATLTDVRASGDVRGQGNIGGLVGYMATLGGNLYRASAHGNVRGVDRVGGLIGTSANVTSGQGDVHDCYATGAVVATIERAGGLVGEADGLDIQKSYARGALGAGHDGASGAFIGFNSGSSISNSFVNGDTNAGLSAIGAGGGSGVSVSTTAGIRNTATFTGVGWDFADTWVMSYGGPALLSEGTPAEFCDTYAQQSTVPFASGLSTTPDGSAANPYHLCTAAQVATVMGATSLWDDHFVLEADIDVSSLSGQIGNGTTAFTGIFDGQGHSLAGFTWAGSSNYSALFGAVSGNGTTTGVVKDVVVASPDVSGGTYVGALVGYLDGGAVSDVFVLNGSVSGVGSSVGGVVGHSTGTVQDVFVSTFVDGSGASVLGGAVGYSSGTLARITATGDVDVVSGGAAGEVGGAFGTISGGTATDCHAYGDVTSNETQVGGLAGQVENGGVLSHCSAAGDVTITGNNTVVGGLVGVIAGANTAVLDSSASGAVSGYQRVGGFAGSLAANATIVHSFATGDATGSSLDVGGFLGYLATNGGSVERSWATGNVVSTSTGRAGGFVGYARSGSITNSYATGNADGGNLGNPVGGFVGYVRDASISRCYSRGGSDQASGHTGSGAFAGKVLDASISENVASSTANPGLSDVADGSGSGITLKSQSDIEDQDNFTPVGSGRDWDFTTVWVMGSEGPELQ